MSHVSRGHADAIQLSSQTLLQQEKAFCCDESPRTTSMIAVPAVGSNTQSVSHRAAPTRKVCRRHTARSRIQVCPGVARGANSLVTYAIAGHPLPSQTVGPYGPAGPFAIIASPLPERSTEFSRKWGQALALRSGARPHLRSSGMMWSQASGGSIIFGEV